MDGRRRRRSSIAAHEDDKRRAALAVMAGSIAPRDISWWFPSGGWREPWRELARPPLARRLTVYLALAFTVAVAGFLTWTVSPDMAPSPRMRWSAFLGSRS
jgi:hypothetical protein